MNHIPAALLLIRLGVGITMILFGFNQIRKPENWLQYIPCFLRFIMPTKPVSFLRFHGSLNLVLGLLLAIGIWQPVIIWICIFRWGSILPFAFYVDFRTGLRDFSIIIALVAALVLS